MADPILSKAEVARAQVKPYGLTGTVTGDIDALAVSHEALRADNETLRQRIQQCIKDIAKIADVEPQYHDEALREQNTALAVRVQEAWAAAEQLRAELAATRQALLDLCYGYLRIQEVGKGSAFAGRAFRAAAELVDVPAGPMLGSDSAQEITVHFRSEWDDLEARLEAVTAVARRYRQGWRPIACVDGPIWCHPDDPNDPDPRLHDALTDAERQALDALEADDA